MQPLPLLALAATLAGCALPEVPSMGLLPAFDAEFEDRIWRDEGADAAPGSIRAFLSDGTMLTASCAGDYRLSVWRRIDASTLVWEDGRAVVRAEIAAIGPRAFALVVDPGGAATPLTFRRIDAPVRCP